MLSLFKLKVARKFLLYLNLFYLLILLFPTFFIFYELKSLIFEQVRKQAESIFQQIVLTRQWIADHGGIYVEKLPWVQPNPYLIRVGENPILISRSGKILVKENPALVTRQLSEYSRKNHLYWFKITSEKFLNPTNKPDPVEERALNLFSQQNLNYFERIEYIEGSPVYRFIKPLYTEQSCLRCHESQGYRVGQVRGALSVFIPINEPLERIASYQKMTLIIFLAGFLVLNGIILFVSQRFIFNYLFCTVNLLKTLRNLYQPRDTHPKYFFKKFKLNNEWQLIIKAVNEFLQVINQYENRLEYEVRRATAELEAKNRMLQEILEKKSFILCNMAHEIKTPLTSLKGSLEYLNLLLNQKEDLLPQDIKGKVTEFLEVARRNSERLITLLTSLVELEKAEANLLELEVTEFLVLEVVKEILALLEVKAAEKKLRYEIEVPEGLTLKADREKVVTILLNLISNAIAHSPEGGTIYIRVKEEATKIIFEIEDEGEGLKEDPAKLFEKFFRQNEGTLGFGLGLTIAKAYVNAQGGEIGAKPGHKGGANFYFSLPRRRGLP